MGKSCAPVVANLFCVAMREASFCHLLFNETIHCGISFELPQYTQEKFVNAKHMGYCLKY